MDDNIEPFKVIERECKLLKDEGAKEIIAISDESNRIVILWKKNGKAKATLINQKYKQKKQNVKLTQKEDSLYNEILVNYGWIMEIKNVDCNEKAHSFTRIYVLGILDGTVKIKHSFYSHCGTEKQRESVNLLLNLYYSLIS